MSNLTELIQEEQKSFLEKFHYRDDYMNDAMSDVEAWLAEHDRRIVAKSFDAVRVNDGVSDMQYTDEERQLMKDIYGETGDKTPEYWKERMTGYNAANSQRREKEEEFISIDGTTVNDPNVCIKGNRHFACVCEICQREMQERLKEWENEFYEVLPIVCSSLTNDAKVARIKKVFEKIIKSITEA